MNRLLQCDFSRLPGTDFERFLADIFTLHGYEVIRMGGAGDQGVDLIVVRTGVRWAVQAKQYSKPVGNSPIQEVYTGMRIHGCHRCVVIATSGYTSGATQAAQAVGCVLLDGRHVQHMIRNGPPLA